MAPRSRKPTPKAAPGEPPAFDVDAEFDEMITAMRGGYAFLKPGLDDTTVVMLATSLIDQFLKFCLLIKFPKSKASRTLMAEVFEGNGPLGTFAAKISVCIALGILSEDVRHDLRILKGVRNQFAHSPNRLYLKDMQTCRSLKLKAKPAVGRGAFERRRFISSCAAIIPILSVYSTMTIAQGMVLNRHKDDLQAAGEYVMRVLFEGADSEEF